LTNIIFSES